MKKAFKIKDLPGYSGRQLRCAEIFWTASRSTLLYPQYTKKGEIYFLFLLALVQLFMLYLTARADFCALGAGNRLYYMLLADNDLYRLY